MYLDLTLRVSSSAGVAESLTHALADSGLNMDLTPRGATSVVRIHGNPAEDFDLALALADLPHQEIARTEIP